MRIQLTLKVLYGAPRSRLPRHSFKDVFGFVYILVLLVKVSPEYPRMVALVTAQFRKPRQ